MRSAFNARAWMAIGLSLGFMTAPVAAGMLGDLNCDERVDAFDIDPFVLALADPAGYKAKFPDCDIMLADINQDGQVDAFDIDPFVDALLAGGVVTHTELAGNPLGAYPWFEYVKAFNENAAVMLAIDPTRYPSIVGDTGDIYLVEAKSANAWQSDPTLLDVTPDGPQTASFGGTLQANMFLVAAPFDLDSAVFDPVTGDFTGLGHAYDLVIDLNQNGRLDGGDYLDGGGVEAGLYILHDTTQLGPLEVTEVPPYSVGAIFGIPASYTDEVLYYPTNIANMGPLPLIVVGHGGGHDFKWYDHIGYHMASYGYIVISHENCYGPPHCTLGHTDALLDLQDVIAGGVLNGKVDPNRIIWIGHSLGGMGVTNAFDTILDGEYTPTHYSADSIVLISAMLPNSYGGPAEANPHHANYHLWTAAGDTDISGYPGSEQTQTFLLHDRATKYRMSTILQGTGHAWFHDGPASPPYFTGPCSIGRDNTHLIQLGLFLPLIKYFAEGNVPASDFFWRQYERFHPIGVDTTDPCIVVTNEYRNGADVGNFFIDDYQSGTALNVSSSGGAVSYTVTNVLEGNLDDANSDFTWTPSDPFNGATHASTGDTSRGVVFDWNGADSYYEWAVVPAARDFSKYIYLSVRGAQGTRHPYTIAVLGDLTFTVTLRDGAGKTSSISNSAYGGGFEEPYQRVGAGTGVGWHDEFEVIRIRVTDFLADGSGLDLKNIAAVRFNFSPSWGSNEGRIVLDELMLTCDYPPGAVPLGTPTHMEEPSAHAEETRPPAGLSAAAPPLPDVHTPTAVAELAYARYFTVEQGYPHYWSQERYWTVSGTLLVVKVDPAVVLPREVAMPVLYVGDVPAWRLNRGYPSGHVIAVVPGTVDLTQVPIWFGAPDFPQYVNAATARAQRDLAERAGIRPLAAAAVEAALAAGGGPVHTVDQRALLRDEVAELILRYSPQEKELAEAFRVPVLQRPN